MASEFAVRPQDVHSPKGHWKLVAVLDDGYQDSDSGSKSCSLAVGRWDGKPVLALRWNGDKDNPIGNPQSRGIPTWFMLPDKYNEAILTAGGLSAANLAVARSAIPAPGRHTDVVEEIDREPHRYSHFFRWQHQHLGIIKGLIEEDGQKQFDPNTDIILHGRLHELQNMRMIELVGDAPKVTYQVTEFGRRVQAANWQG